MVPKKKISPKINFYFFFFDFHVFFFVTDMFLTHHRFFQKNRFFRFWSKALERGKSSFFGSGDMKSRKKSRKTLFPKYFQLLYQYRDDLCYLHQRKSLFGEKKILKKFSSKKKFFWRYTRIHLPTKIQKVLQQASQSENMYIIMGVFEKEAMLEIRLSE